MEKEKASLEVLRILRELYCRIMMDKEAVPSPNEFVQRERERESKEGETAFRKSLPTFQLPVIGWSLIAHSVTQDASGQGTITCSIARYDRKDGKGSSMTGMFRTTNDTCLKKVKNLNPPCIVKVFGNYRGCENNKALQDAGFYTLFFDLDDIWIYPIGGTGPPTIR